MNTGQSWAIGAVCRDAPEVSQAKRVGGCIRYRKIVQIKMVFPQVLSEPFVILFTVSLEQFGPSFWNVYFTNRVGIDQTLRGGKVVAAQKSVCVGVCGVYVKGIDIGRHRTWFRVLRIEWDAVQIRFQPEITEEQQVLQEEIPSYLPIFAEIQAAKIIFFEGENFIVSAQLNRDFVKIAGKGPSPTQCVCRFVKRGGHELIKRIHDFGARKTGMRRVSVRVHWRISF